MRLFWGSSCIFICSPMFCWFFLSGTRFNAHWTVAVYDWFVKRSWVSIQRQMFYAPWCAMPILHWHECFAQPFLSQVFGGLGQWWIDLAWTFGTRTQLTDFAACVISVHITCCIWNSWTDCAKIRVAHIGVVDCQPLSSAPQIILDLESGCLVDHQLGPKHQTRNSSGSHELWCHIEVAELTCRQSCGETSDRCEES